MQPIFIALSPRFSCLALNCFTIIDIGVLKNRDALWYCIGDRTKKISWEYKDQFPQIKDLSL